MKTSYYTHAAKLDRGKFYLVRTSLGSPRFLKCDSVAELIAPEREWLDLSESAYRRKYLAKLAKVGVSGFRKMFAQLQKQAGKKELVLLCFESLSPENVEDGQFCHRRIFADWWEKETGEAIQELTPHRSPRAVQQSLL